ncbi:MAG: DUF4493 domain-containing protein [Muribaculaceae bacterium]|nr:DUF4493 domain-containing protein [Muribaculaceae bacterium]
MKKNLLFPGMLLLVGSLSLSSCGEDPAGGKSGKGSIAPLVGVDAGFLGMDVITKAGGDITTDDLSLTVTSSDGSFNQTWESFSDFNPEEEQFPIGDYTVEVAYGDREAEGFDNKVIAAYYDSQDVKILEGAATPVELTASRTHAIVNIKYTDAFEHYIKSGSVDLISSTGNGITYVYNDDKPETRSSLIVPGRTKVLVDIEKYNGTWIHNVEAANFVTKARGRYTVTLDVNEGSLGSASLSVVIDDNVTEEVIEVDISDDVVEAPAPEIVLEGVQAEGKITVVEGTYSGDPIKVTFIAKGGLAAVNFKAQSTFLGRRAAWEAATDPDGVELLSLEQGQQGKYKQYGLDCHGIWNQPGDLAVIDMTAIINSIENLDNDIINKNVSTFTFVAKDKYSKESEPVSFSIEVLPVELSLLNPSYLKIFDTDVEVDMSFNGGDPTELVKFEYKNGRGTYEPLTIKSITHISGNNFRVHLSDLPSEEYDAVIRAEINGRRSPELTIPRHGVIPTVYSNNIFATKAYITFTSEHLYNVELTQLINPKFTLTSNGNKVLSTSKIAEDIYLVSGLNPGMTNEISITFNNPDIYCVPVNFITENATPLPDAGFEDWSSEKKGDLQYLWKIDNHNAWSTVNELTISTYGSGIGSAAITGGASYKATSGTIPANGRSNYSSADGGGVGTARRFDGHTNGDATLHSDKSHSGNNAALIRTVGWGKGNTANGATAFNLKDNAGFATCENVTVGELYLGKYINGAPSYGYSFNSRPSAVQFYYHYDVVSAGNGDYGSAEVTIYDENNNVISTNRVELGEKSAYEKISIPLLYDYNTNKAAKISVIFKSSENPKALNKDTKFWHTPGSNNTSGGEYVGSELYIDDIELIY